MAVIEYDSYKQKLHGMDDTIDNLYKALEIESAKHEIERLLAEAEEEGFWNDVERSQKNQTQLKQLQSRVQRYEKLAQERDDLLALVDMGTEMDDDSLLPELEAGYAELEQKLDAARLTTLLSGEYDHCNAILEFHPGAGGTEAQDWAEMLYRMYMQWANKHGFEFEMLDYLDGDEAGLKSATVMIRGENAYGYLKGEHGVHRLVRVSPFDANARRQTSFAALEVMPELPQDIEVEIRPEDIEMQVYRSSGAGGQHINKTSSAVRLIHKPTGIVTACQTQRSQFQNRDYAMEMLKAKLVQLKLQQHAEKISDLKGVQLKIEWGSQIRSYVFMPYQLVKDNRTDYETGNIQAVMDGELDGFIITVVAAHDAPATAKAIARRQDAEFLAGKPANWRDELRKQDLACTIEKIRSLADALSELRERRSVVVIGPKEAIEGSSIDFQVTNLVDEA